VPPDRVLVGHSGTTDLDYLKRLDDTGCTVEWDNFGNTSAGESAGIIESLRECIRCGYAAQTVLANDASAYCDWETRTGSPRSDPYPRW
jgi:phosphotriesterase-related protein